MCVRVHAGNLSTHQEKASTNTKVGDKSCVDPTQS
jgi:hypothetical protein